MSTPRPVKGFTIDAPTSTDLDDAIWVRGLPGLNWRVWVTIAAAADAVPRGSLEDIEARARVETRYHEAGHKGMLPFSTEKRLSLVPYRQRAGLTIELDLNVLGEVTRAEVYPSRLESVERLAHADVPGILDNLRVTSVQEELTAANGLALTLLARRRRAGAMALYDVRHGWVTGEDGRVQRVPHQRATVGYVIVQELMILANAELAKFARANEIPILYRVHAARGAAPDRAALLADLEAAQVAESPDVDALAGRLEHALERARYSAIPAPHWGLALDLYTHLTSPIRRYADLASQRQLLAFLRGDPLPYTAPEMEGLADHVNRVLADREARASAKRAAAADAAGARVLAAPASGEALASLDAARFERVLKVAVRSGGDCPQPLAAEVRARLAADRLPTLGKGVVLLHSPPAGEGWAQLRADTLASIAAREPGEATSILAIGTSLGLLPAVDRDVTQACADGPFVAVSRAHLDSGTRASVPRTAPRKKLAQALADVTLLAALRDLPVPEGAPAAEQAPPPAARGKLRVDPAKHPVSMLLEILAAAHAPAPEFVTTPKTQQTFACECRFVLGVDDGAVKGMGRGEGSSKGAAKEGAARRALEWLVLTGAVEGAGGQSALASTISPG